VLARSELLRWLYLGRVTLVSGIFLGALFAGRTLPGALGDTDTRIALLLLVVGVAVTLVSFWWTHLVGREPGPNFLYAQVVLDVFLVTAVVHITGGDGSDFAPLYILVISEGALLLPLPGGVLIGALASLAYFADIVWFHGDAIPAQLALQIGLFALVAIITGVLGDRFRRTGLRLGVVESELEQLRLDTSDILDSLQTGVLTVDGGGRLAYLNSAGAKLLGLDAHQWIGAPVVGVLEEVAPGLGTVIRRSIEDGTPLARAKATAYRGGQEITLGVSTTVLDRDDDQPPSATAIFQDITREERLGVLNRRNDRLEAVAELSASLAHEIKNPLASIRSAVEQLTRTRLDQTDRGTLEQLVLGESDRLSRLLSEFLEFSGLRMGRNEPLDFAEVVRGAVSVARHHPDAQDGVEVHSQGLDEPLGIPGDADLLHRAVFNLVLNAIQFSASGGRVDVTLEDLRHETGLPVAIASPVRLTVRDSGPGVPPGETERIFQPFFTTRKGGSGLGLSVVQRAVEAHRGALLVETAPGGGAEFILYLSGRRAGDEVVTA
jgi:two-component system sensor histidine kinase PilS (NtrC family)